MPSKKLSQLTEKDVSLICSHNKNCTTCPIYIKNMTNCLTSDNTNKLSVVYNDCKLYVPVKEGKYYVGYTPSEELVK